MSNDGVNTRDTVREMAKLAVLSDRISSIHEKNLTHFPFVAFNGINFARIEYDFSRVQEEGSTTSVSKIIYHLSIDESANNDYLDRRCAAIEQWVRQLLWKGISIEILINDISKYKSKENE